VLVTHPPLFNLQPCPRVLTWVSPPEPLGAALPHGAGTKDLNGSHGAHCVNGAGSGVDGPPGVGRGSAQRVLDASVLALGRSRLIAVFHRFVAFGNRIFALF